MHRLAVFIVPLALLSACSSGQERTSKLLDHRMHMQLASAITAGAAVVQREKDGVRITLTTPSLLPNDRGAMDNRFADPRSDVIEGLLDPALMRVAVTDTSDLPPDERETRVDNVLRYFEANGLGSVLREGEPIPGSPGPAGLTIAVSVHCPPPNGLIGYSNGERRPACN